MPRVAPRVPESTDVLCERCGYVLNGLPADGRCPECGKPIAESVGTQRVPTAWDVTAGDVTAGSGPTRTDGFVRTTVALVRRPTAFYRTFATRGSVRSARSFAQVSWLIAGLLFGLAAATHTVWYWSYIETVRLPSVLDPRTLATFAAVAVGLTIGTYLALDGVTRLAARLTTWEGTYRGYRLPYTVVLRAMYYHSAHYLPVAALTFVTVVGYVLLLAVNAVGSPSAYRYLLVLGGEVIVFAFYLFQTYWIGMRNMMYANR